MKKIKMMTFNANGIRSAIKKGFFDWFKTQDIDVLCLQETKAQMAELDLPEFELPGYARFHADAIKKGYSGVAIYTRLPSLKVETRLDFPQADQEGRYLQIAFEKFTVVSLYLPSGAAGPHRQVAKFEFMDFWGPWLEACRKSGTPTLICGDWNIVHREIDIRNFKANQKNSGCLPEERAWLDTLISQKGWIDCFRVINQEPFQYTWWSHRGQARAKNVGWRIDYQIGTPEFQGWVKSVEIFKDQWFSDHAPLIMTYEIP